MGAGNKPRRVEFDLHAGAATVLRIRPRRLGFTLALGTRFPVITR